MKVYNYISMLLIAGAASLFSCSQEEELNKMTDGVSSAGFRISVSDNGFLNATPGTRAVENEYATEFVEGDAIGIFGVDNGMVVDDINNRKFTMKGGNWVLDDGGKIIEYKGTEFGKMKFYAYYPYSQNVKFDAQAALADGGDPFAEYVNGWKPDNNQEGEEYTKYDLMTSSSSAVVDNRFKGEIKFTMEHRMALVVLKMPKLVYDFANTDVTLDDYELPIINGTFTLNGDEAVPYYQESTDTYRFLVKPETEVTIEGNYTGVKEMVYTATATLNKGVAKVYTINDANRKEYTLAIGDYYCADGSIVSKDEQSVPDNVIGIVCYVGNPQPSVMVPGTYTETNDILRNDYPDCKHGLVIALDNTGDAAFQWGNKNPSTGTADALFGDWFGTDEEWQNRLVSNFNESNKGGAAYVATPGFLGYNNTFLLTYCYENIRQYPCDNAYNQIMNYRSEVDVPSMVTDWYIPSTVELEEVAKGLTAINSSIAAAQGTALSTDNGGYFSSNERSTTHMWYHKLTENGQDITMRERGSGGKLCRLMLAF